MSVEKLPQLIPAGEPFLFVTKMPPDEVTESLLLSRVRAAQLRTGDAVIVQCQTHHGDELVAECEWRVIARKDELRTRDLDGFQTMQDTALAYQIAQVRPWWRPLAPDAAGGPQVKWNAGKKAHQVIDGGVVVFESADKNEALDYATRHAA